MARTGRGRLVTWLGAAAAASVAVVLGGGSASAGVGASTSITGPAGLGLGQTASGSLTIANTNTPPNHAETNTVTSIRIAPSCGSVGSAGNLCPSPDPGVFSLQAATGAAGTACAGVAFTVSAADATGVVTLAPGTPVVLQPPGGTPGTERCTVNFNIQALRVPTSDASASPGTQTLLVLSASSTSSPSGLQVTTFSPQQITVGQGQAAIATQVSASPVMVGALVTDVATVTGASGSPKPTGTVTFRVFGPNDATCSFPIATSTNVLGPGAGNSSTAVSTPFQTIAAGSYHWVASYSGDANYLGASSSCLDPAETFVVSTPVTHRVNDFDGNGTTDVAVFRPSNGTWYLRTATPQAVSFGQSGDVPVPGDYDGNGTTDIAVFRPSNSGWYLRIGSGQFVAWGGPDDIPVPGDYDGNGTTDIAVFRPSNGTWYLRTATPQAVAFGQSGDIPVPGDYDGNGTTDIAVFRPSNNGWYLRIGSGQFVAWGGPGDVPVPGDYDGNGTTDIAVFRPSNGTWYLRTGTPQAVSFGQSGDLPMPGDYDGNGTTDVAVFRPSNSWFLSTPTPQYVPWGAGGDQPLSLPDAIARFFPPPA